MKSYLADAAALLGIPSHITSLAVAAADDLSGCWSHRDAHALGVSAKVMAAFAGVGLNESHLAGTTGYGYHDVGRVAYERIMAVLMGAEAALARPQIVSGTHAIVLALSTLLGSGDTLCSLTGRPYDTLRQALVDHPRALCRRGVAYCEAGDIDAMLDRRPQVAFVQRSRGYASRPSLTIADIRTLVSRVRDRSPETLVVVDNCYGELVELEEPCQAGADVAAGSLIKNPGGGMALAGAYVAGSTQIIARIADHAFAPGLGGAIGPGLGATRWALAGLHRAPRTVCEGLKVADFAAALFSRLGYAVDPLAGGKRTDIIQAIALGTPEKLLAFANGLQRLLPVNSKARPEPGHVPGYRDPVVMAGGAFIDGSTMELSCDAPLRPPYEMYLQGGMDLAHGMLAAMSAAAAVSAVGR
ncbi:MAG: methionine gamma-lyase family protein [Candidatus Eremiobacteraeota bacterium]|nr:methionine gamma-lyase family protein [Candidatus Eremiobacteraeota bacterium]MBC5828545.1 methionine gamma-lyase family protein [Candidatus Eremiobacteraeota bacterium]